MGAGAIGPVALDVGGVANGVVPGVSKAFNDGHTVMKLAAGYDSRGGREHRVASDTSFSHLG